MVSYLLRQSYREGPKVKHRTLANLSALPVSIIEAIRHGLAGEELIPAHKALTITRSRPHGHVAAVLSATQKEYCVFCDIVGRKYPASIFYEGDSILGFIHRIRLRQNFDGLGLGLSPNELFFNLRLVAESP